MPKDKKLFQMFFVFVANAYKAHCPLTVRYVRNVTKCLYNSYLSRPNSSELNTRTNHGTSICKQASSGINLESLAQEPPF
jgi:hypothetical protein